ncbi:hypothetical protein ATM97_06935 [Nocardia sp. MH4]|uniref:hypothetical protein n=1 Tax=Nocardia sp. MH4 TaxID=1768677 RepID=UPI001C4F239E|nr:hypothetical protein [Nocardia sp. MH4]MBW0270748.1 hypothetical protein [Nocardia sp. MH4]
MQYRPTNVDRRFGRIPRHALGVTAAAVAFAVIAKRIADERRKSSTRVAPIAGWRSPAEVIRTAVVVCDGVIVPTAPPADPDPTVPLMRAELLAAVKVDGGRPMHDLDLVQRACCHADSLYGRCADCGMTWAAQAAAMGGAR